MLSSPMLSHKGQFVLRVPFALVLLMLLVWPVLARAQAKPAPDTVIFINGEQLTGELEKADGAGITFKSTMAGELSVKWANIRELRSAKKFAVLAKGQKLTRRDAFSQVPEGQVTVAGEGKQQQITVTPTAATQSATAAASRTIPVADASLLVEGAAFDKAVNHPPTLLAGWGGTVSAGASVVKATENSTTFNGSVALVRANPEVSWLPSRDRTLIGYTQSYGTTTETGTLPLETNIFHANGERDEYFAPRLFAFGSATFDHNFSQNLDLEAAYGGGIGLTVIRSAKQQLDVKGDVHLLKESFFVNSLNPTPAANVNVVASTFSETYVRKLPKALTFSEFGSISPSWTNEADFAAHVNGSLGFPLFKGLGFNVTYVDDFLNNAPAGTEKNSTQFTTGITYTIKPK